MEKERISYLLNAYTSGNISAEEGDELMEWISKADKDEALREYMAEIWNGKSTGDFSHVDWKKLFKKIKSASIDKDRRQATRVRRMIWTSAASVLLIVTASYFYFNIDKQNPQTIAQKTEKDIAPPAEDRAVLILADGTTILMGNVGRGKIAMQGGMNIVKSEDGSIAYTGEDEQVHGKNTFRVPRGSNPLNLVLSDGSKVWLNVGSSITFPTAFIGKERVVEMEGEAYFEVSHNPLRPFRVKNGDITVNVLGTHFNVNGYRDNGKEKVTLLEGSVIVQRKGVSKALKPGQQAQISERSGEIGIKHNVDLEEVLAWQKGKFIFTQDMDIHDIMNQLGRWYDVEVEFRGEITQHFWGTISKDVNLSEVLKILEATGGVKFEVNGNKIVVIPVKEIRIANNS